jgi:hypothetical protein
MNKIIFLLFIIFFFLDFSFVSSLLGSGLSWPYFTLSLLIATFLFGKNMQMDSIWGILAILSLNILLPFNLFGYILIVIIIWGCIYFLKNIFFSEDLSYLKSNFSFIINFILFGGVFFTGQYIQAKITEGTSFGWGDISWTTLTIKLLIGIFIYNLVYKSCGKNIQALK